LIHAEVIPPNPFFAVRIVRPLPPSLQLQIIMSGISFTALNKSKTAAKNDCDVAANIYDNLLIFNYEGRLSRNSVVIVVSAKLLAILSSV
jgi:hypothetical protein